MSPHGRMGADACSVQSAQWWQESAVGIVHRAKMAKKKEQQKKRKEDAKKKND